jgi:hypothetical protein
LEQFCNKKENGGNIILLAITIIVTAPATINKTGTLIYINDIIINIVLTFKRNSKEASKPSKVKKAKKFKNEDNNKYVLNKNAKNYNKNEKMLNVNKNIA